MQNEALYHWAALSPDAQHWECCLSPWYTCYQHLNVECGCHSMCTEWILFFLNPHPRTCSLILERGEGREREEKPQYEREPLVTSHTCPDWVLFLYADSFSMHPEDQTRNLGMCPDQESNPRPFSVWDYAPTNWATPARNSFFKKRDFIYLFLERWEGRERNIGVWEIHQLVASHTPPTRDLACNPGMCTDWESNRQPFGSQAGAQSTESHQPGLNEFFMLWLEFMMWYESLPLQVSY